MIPPDELLRFLATVREAMTLGAGGSLQEGYDHLDVALAIAETPPLDPRSMTPLQDVPWAEELTLAYRRALMLYAAVFMANSGSVDHLSPEL